MFACGIRLCKLFESQIEDVLVVGVVSDRTRGKRVFWLMLFRHFSESSGLPPVRATWSRANGIDYWETQTPTFGDDRSLGLET